MRKDTHVTERDHLEGGWDENVQPSFLRRIFLIVVSLIFLLGILYISGFHQIFFLRTTEPPTNPPSYESLIHEKEVSIPLSVVLFKGADLLGSYRDEDNVSAMVKHASAIWGQADLLFRVENIKIVELSESQERAFLSDPYTFIQERFRETSHTITVVLLRTLEGLNGLAFGGMETVAVADYTSFTDYRTLAHELGHVLGLEHTKEPGRLMNSGGTGTELLPREAEEVYTTALRLFEE